MGVRPKEDLGVPSHEEATSLSLTTSEPIDDQYALPAHKAYAIVLASPTRIEPVLSRSRTFIYTLEQLRVIEVLKGNRSVNRGTKTAQAAEFGGSILFPSGHLATFLLSGFGFMECDKEYLLFLRQPILGDPTFTVIDGYKLDNEVVRPITTPSTQKIYEGASVAELTKKVKRLIREDRDSD